MDRRLVTAACIIAILISVTVFFIFSRPITGTWVCTDRLTEHSLLTDEVTVITLRSGWDSRFPELPDVPDRPVPYPGRKRYMGAGRVREIPYHDYAGDRFVLLAL